LDCKINRFTVKKLDWGNFCIIYLPAKIGRRVQFPTSTTRSQFSYTGSQHWPQRKVPLMGGALWRK